MSEAPVEVVPRTHREKCLYWAKIFAIPYRGSTPRANEVSQLAARALVHYAEKDEP